MPKALHAERNSGLTPPHHAPDAQGLDRPIHGVFRQTTGGSQPLAKTNDAREGIDDAELSRTGRLGNQQAAIVGPQVKRAMKRRIAT